MSEKSQGQRTSWHSADSGLNVAETTQKLKFANSIQELEQVSSHNAKNGHSLEPNKHKLTLANAFCTLKTALNGLKLVQY